MQIDFSQNSTKRGAIWLGYAVLSLAALIFGKPEYIAYLGTVAAGVAGGIGVAFKD